ncbi:MAG: hypothetical protein IKC70_04985 [Bacteroidaceae bacterium]|nr:hypothetical protein [Bacteroidaceae bacterium]
MLFLRCLFPSLLLMLFSLLSCSSDSKYPYTIVEGDSYNTRLYKLPSGVKLYIARTTEQPRVAAALYMPSVASDTLGNLYSESVYSSEYPMLFARIGSDVSSAVNFNGSPIIYNNTPSNELENWAVLMLGSFVSFPDSLTIVLFGDIVYDDAVATIMRHFEKVPRIPSSSADCHIDEKTLLETVRLQFLDNLSAEDSKKTLSLSDVRRDAKNSIKLLPSPPAKVIFPDLDNLKIKSAPGQPRMVVDEKEDTLFTLIVRNRLKELPTAFLMLIKEYFDASLSLENDSVPYAIQVRADKNSHSLDFYVSGRAENMQQNVTQAIQRCKLIANGDDFYKYLLANSEAVSATKNDYENMAMQAATYIAGGKRLCGMREIAEYSMNALFSSTSDIYFCGKDSDKIYPLLLNMLDTVTAPSLCDFSAADDTLARYYLLPSDSEAAVTVTLGDAYESVEDFATIALFNKAASFAVVTPSVLISFNGTLLSVEDTLPFTHDAFEAAKSFLLYDCSTYGGNVKSLFKEYIFSDEHGYTSAQFYDALMRLSFSDVEDFYLRHKENSFAQLIIGRESNLSLRELKNKGRVVHITSSELFGY